MSTPNTHNPIVLFVYPLHKLKQQSTRSEEQKLIFSVRLPGYIPFYIPAKNSIICLFSKHMQTMHTLVVNETEHNMGRRLAGDVQ